jgi:class 3 adenylate cyclase
MSQIQRKNLSEPDEVRPYDHGVGSLIRIGTNTIGHGVLEPGWRWTTHMGPVMGTPSCPVHHVQFLVSGRFGVRMDDGEEIILEPNDVADIPPGHDAWVEGDTPVVILDIGGNIDAIGVPREHRRIVTTLLMTDIVDSTRMASELGDQAWRQRLADHNRVVRTQLVRADGTEVSTTGDGFLATFGSAAAALRAAAAIRDGVREAGVQIRAGVHTGEVELLPGDIGGIAVHAVARIMALAGPSEVLVSAVTVGLAEGSGVALEPAGSHVVKGLERPIEVYRLLA